MICPKCGATIEAEGAEFCPFCGASIKVDEGAAFEGQPEVEAEPAAKAQPASLYERVLNYLVKRKLGDVCEPSPEQDPSVLQLRVELPGEMPDALYEINCKRAHLMTCKGRLAEPHYIDPHHEVEGMRAVLDVTKRHMSSSPITVLVDAEDELTIKMGGIVLGDEAGPMCEYFITTMNAFFQDEFDKIYLAFCPPSNTRDRMRGLVEQQKLKALFDNRGIQYEFTQLKEENRSLFSTLIDLGDIDPRLKSHVATCKVLVDDDVYGDVSITFEIIGLPISQIRGVLANINAANCETWEMGYYLNRNGMLAAKARVPKLSDQTPEIVFETMCYMANKIRKQLPSILQSVDVL